MTDGNFFESAWLRCRVSASYKPSEALVRVVGARSSEPPAFFVATTLVRPQPSTSEEIDGEVRVTLLNRNNGTSIVEVSGEPVSYGPKIEVPSALLT